MLLHCRKFYTIRNGSKVVKVIDTVFRFFGVRFFYYQKSIFGSKAIGGKCVINQKSYVTYNTNVRYVQLQIRLKQRYLVRPDNNIVANNLV